MQPYGEVKQFLIKKSSIINAYGGEIFGLGVEVSRLKVGRSTH